MIRERISAMGDEHTNWLSALDFYKQELGIIKERLTEIAGKNTGKEVASEVEHFENQVKLQSEGIDVLCHDINSNLAKAAHEAMGNHAGYIDAELVELHEKHKARFMATEAIIRDLRKDFGRFATQWM